MTVRSASSPGPWRWTAVVAATAGGLSQTPAAFAEAIYAHGAYPWIQRTLTGASNLVPFALFDVLCAVLLAVVVRIWWRAAQARRHTPSWQPLVAAVLRTLLVAGVAVVWFQLAWGLNYARPPVDVRLALPLEAPTASEVGALLTRAVAGANADHAAAHAAGFPGRHDVPAALVAALHEVERADGRARPTLAGRPKATLLGAYFRIAGVDGLTAPAVLETLLNPDLTGPERPFVLAHEWAQQAGYAPEADANFAAFRAVMRGGPAARYSGWLFLLGEAARQVPREPRREALAALGGGPRDDLTAIERRAATQVDVVQRLGWRVYDGYLRSQGVAEGVRSYSRVTELLVRFERSGRSSPPPSQQP
jgi:hypothetical protein